jgi:protein ImuB
LLTAGRPCFAQTWGPERIETGWWRGQAVGRDYYRVETTDGRRFWIFRNLEDNRWFLHGVFD